MQLCSSTSGADRAKTYRAHDSRPNGVENIYIYIYALLYYFNCSRSIALLIPLGSLFRSSCQNSSSSVKTNVPSSKGCDGRAERGGEGRVPVDRGSFLFSRIAPCHSLFSRLFFFRRHPSLFDSLRTRVRIIDERSRSSLPFCLFAFVSFFSRASRARASFR